VDTVEPAQEGFRLRGRGGDAADYVMELRLEVPVDARTKSVLGELFSQSEWRIWRRVRQGIRVAERARSARRSPAKGGAS
ncbi:MAG TPA: hypothetical protein VD793_10415, partial [Gemmatimonadales bacterium]|nr:hypothetical protein [Gemmatimonadales bacterium]